MKPRGLLWVLLTGLALLPRAAWGCAACYGQSDSPLAQGMNWGILSLLAVIVTVLGGVAAFFVYLAKRAVVVASGADAQGSMAAGPSSTT
jgi:hypothetical protein